MIPKSMSDLMDFHHEVVDPEASWKDPGGVNLFRLVDTTPAERAAGLGVRKRVPIAQEEAIEIYLALERELWKARDAGTWNEDEDFETLVSWDEIVIKGVGGCPVCSGCNEIGLELERRRATDPEIVAHFKKDGIDLTAIHEEHREEDADGVA